MKKQRFLTAIALAAAFMFAGCGGTESGESDKSTADTGSIGSTASVSDTESDNTTSDIESENSAATSEEEGIVLTEDTDFSALISEQVTEEEWRAAFDRTAYDNCRVKVTDLDGEFVGSFEAGGGVSKAYMPYEGDTAIFCEYTDGLLTVYWKDDYGVDKIQLSEGDEHFENLLEIYNVTGFYTIACPYFGENYSDFTYDEVKGRYIYDGAGITTNVVLEFGDTTYTHAEIVIINGKIAYAEYYEKEGGGPDGEYGCNARSYFYDFGATEVVMPEEGSEEE